MLLSSSQLLELFVFLCTADHFRYGISKIGAAFALAESKSGPVRPDSMPTRLRVALFGLLQAFITFLVPMVYSFAIVTARFQRPQWMNAFALPEVILGVNVEGTWKNTVRVLVCVAGIAMRRLSDDAFEHLGDQYHPIGRREKPRVVQTGPYAWVRHPLYTMWLVQGVLWSLVFWSYAPLYVLLATVAVLAVKIPIEEEAIQRDEAMREEYRAYMKKVPSKLVPHVW
ncbi:hypothetical protein J3R83DRAFT_12562 [Lanmaoa asiatica]|nr:hypothetical protein J3R83DRAFT_12562 [Lanmaoa asiatica]